MKHPAQNVKMSTMDTGHPHPLERHLAIVCHAVTNAAKRITPEKLPTAVITPARNGCNGLVSIPRALDAAVLGAKYLRGPIKGTKPHGQKTTSFHYQGEVQMTSATFSHSVTNASSVKMLAPNPSFKRDA